MAENDELTAAVGRMRQFYEWAHNHYEGDPPNPYQDEKPVTTPTTELMADDKEEIVQAYLAEHPADDAESVTAPLRCNDDESDPWLLAVGFERSSVFGGCHRLPFSFGWLTRTDRGQWYLDGSGYARLPDQPTRGHIRRLAAALGIALKGPA